MSTNGDMPSTRSYKDAIRALNSLQSNFATVAVRRSAAVDAAKLMPEMLEWTARCGYTPEQLDSLNVVHVTGTKGKGSTCAFTHSILERYRSAISGPITRMGMYTSPHLKSVRERIMLDGQPLDEARFTRYFFEIWDKLGLAEDGGEERPAYFRFLTLLSFHVFKSEGVDTAIYEVGVGGQYDSTNVFVRPTVTGITALGIDHTTMLGTTLAEIAWNKAGIFKKGTPAVTVVQPEEGMKVIRERAAEREVASLEVVEKREGLAGIKLGLAGEFQKQNAAVAVELARLHLKALGVAGMDFGLQDPIPLEFERGLEAANWPGRCQTIHEDTITWFIDGAHTLESVHVASEWFGSVVPKQRGQRVLLFNQQTRDVAALIRELYETVAAAGVKFDHVIFTTNLTWSSGTYSDDLVSINTSQEQVDELVVQKRLAELWSQMDDKKSRKHIFHDIETSVNFIRSLEGPVDVFVCGSLHLVGGFLTVLDK
ncbi:unnamed protein product [Kuraishia capsulata CBS 1993]|uniref:Folylpolyglutamate synthase n=1 Tax=Kuraishia capsulata CBS 1993 TaxID=1382522 RepID=W6MM90_9ASCO|nr:uncharacterized protein KUCA_T00001973001 [Kuraishia capsulata CBS 1993]CDK26002.1 unnamed protein product [Kuraishia capsulata CBS 1993]